MKVLTGRFLSSSDDFCVTASVTGDMDVPHIEQISQHWYASIIGTSTKQTKSGKPCCARQTDF
jgi:hypothetical protein